MRFTSMLIAFVLTAAACGGSDNEAGSEGAGGNSPIGEFLGQPDFFGDEEGAQQQIVAQERETEQRVAECMRELGFEYIPRDVDDTIFFGADGEEEFGSDEWVAKYGFGITTQRFAQSQVGPDLVGFDDSVFEDQIADDPNQEIMQAMTESERAAYEEALWGEDVFAFDETLSDEEIQAQLDEEEFIGPGGCYGEAWNDDPSIRFFQAFEQELDELEEQISGDPRIVEAEQAIADCVAERGLDYTPEEELWEEYEDELREIESTIDYEAFEGSFEDLEEGEEPDFASFEPPELPEEGKVKLAALQAEEIELAVATDDCGGGFRDRRSATAEVRAEYEQQWLDDNADRVADYAAE